MINPYFLQFVQIFYNNSYFVCFPLIYNIIRGSEKLKKIYLVLVVSFLLIGELSAIAGSEKTNLTISKNETFEQYDMLVIAPEKFSSELQSLIDHKNIHGVQTILKTTEEIYNTFDGLDKAEQVKYFIKDAIEQWNISYVLLVGGRQGQRFRWYIPYRFSNVDDGFMHKQFLSDLYFADIYKNSDEFEDWDSNENGIFSEWYEDDPSPTDIMDLIPDVAVGRLPCRYKNEVTTIVKKIIDYENNAHEEDWLNRALLIGGDTNPGVGDPFPYEGEADCNYTEQLLTDFNVTKLIISDGSLTGYNDFINEFNKGNCFVLFHGHGLQDSLFTHTTEGEQITVFHTDYISELNNEGMYPIMVVGCCATTEFDVGIFNFLTIFKNLKQHHFLFGFKYECVPEVFSWDMMKNPDKGVIAHIGSSSTAWGAAGDDNHDEIPDSVQFGYTTGLCAEFFKLVGEEEVDILGDAYSTALTKIIENHNAKNDRIQCKCVQEFQLIGDPSLKIGGY